MAYNSTIRTKFGECPLCNNGKEVALTKGLCQSHYWLGVRLKSANKQNERDTHKIIQEEELSDLIMDADAVFSRYIRLRDANSKGYLNCYICQSPVKWQQAQCMHFVKRGNLFLRWDERNCKTGDKNCNEYKGGNYLLYVKRLEAESPGITSILMEESRLVYKPTRTEIKNIITEYTIKLKQLQNELSKL